jgi:protein TonB
MRRAFTFVSVIVHAIVITSAFIAQVLAVGPLPTPHGSLNFVGSMPIRLVDIPLPRPAPRATTPPAPSASINAAPLVAPPDIGKEPEVDPLPSRVPDGGVDGSITTGISIATLAVAPPPPPPSPPVPQEPVRLRSGMQVPRKVANVDPVYPRVAQEARIEGIVILEATIDARGRVVDVRVLRSQPLLDQAAVDAVRQWIYTPTLLNGVPIPIVMTVTVNFKLQDR